jgi:hypothetical protein
MLAILYAINIDGQTVDNARYLTFEYPVKDICFKDDGPFYYVLQKDTIVTIESGYYTGLQINSPKTCLIFPSPSSKYFFKKGESIIYFDSSYVYTVYVNINEVSRSIHKYKIADNSLNLEIIYKVRDYESSVTSFGDTIPLILIEDGGESGSYTYRFLNENLKEVFFYIPSGTEGFCNGAIAKCFDNKITIASQRVNSKKNIIGLFDQKGNFIREDSFLLDSFYWDIIGGKNRCLLYSLYRKNANVYLIDSLLNIKSKISLGNANIMQVSYSISNHRFILTGTNEIFSIDEQSARPILKKEKNILELKQSANTQANMILYMSIGKDRVCHLVSEKTKGIANDEVRKMGKHQNIPVYEVPSQELSTLSEKKIIVKSNKMFILENNKVTTYEIH